MAHDGHRERLRKKFLKDPSVFEDHELFELLLFFSIPRVNTNNTAHDIIDRFGSIRGVMNADIEDLKTVDNVGENSAILIKLVAELIARYERTQFNTKSLLLDKSALEKYVQSLFIGVSVERVYFLLFDSSLHLSGYELIAEGNASNTNIATSSVIAAINKYRPVYVVMAHNHPSGTASPSGADIYTTNNVFNILKMHNIQMIEHYIVAGDDIIGILKDSRSITTLNDVKSLEEIVEESKNNRIQRRKKAK